MRKVNVRYIVDDVDTSIEFYADRLDFDVTMRPAPGFAALERGDLGLLLNVPGAGGAGQRSTDGRSPEPGGWNRIQIVVDDLEKTIERMRSNGVTIRTDIVVGKGGAQAVVEDPAGNPVELFEPNRGTA